MSISDVDICNKALYKIGEERITTLGENTKFGLICNDIYESIRDEVQEAHPWTFTIEWIELQPLAGVTHPVFGGHAFQLPENVLRPLEVNGNPRWRWEKRILFADDANCTAKCIVRVEDESQFTPTFVEAFACRLAMELSYSAANSASLKTAAAKEYEAALSLARTYNSQSAGTPPKAAPRTSWAGGRGRFGGGWR